MKYSSNAIGILKSSKKIMKNSIQIEAATWGFV